MTGIRQNWAVSFARAGEELWMMEEEGQTALYQSKYAPEQIQINGRWEYKSRPAPVWHVWDGDDWVYCGKSMQDAYATYREAIGRRASHA